MTSAGHRRAGKGKRVNAAGGVRPAGQVVVLVDSPWVSGESDGKQVQEAGEEV